MLKTEGRYAEHTEDFLDDFRNLGDESAVKNFRASLRAGRSPLHGVRAFMMGMLIDCLMLISKAHTGKLGQKKGKAFQEAEEWLNSDDGPMTADVICEEFGLDVAAVRAAVLNPAWHLSRPISAHDHEGSQARMRPPRERSLAEIERERERKRAKRRSAA